MNILTETRGLMMRLLHNDSIGLASVSVVGRDPASLSITIAAGEMPIKMPPPPYVGHRREILAGVVQRMQSLRWSAIDDFTLSLPMPDDTMLDALHEKHAACRSSFECGAGWVWLLDACLSYVSESGAGEWQSSQIKEKFGGLRLYHFGDTGPDGDDIIDAAEWISVHVCDICGGPGQRRTGGWIVTRCDVHANYAEL